MPLFTRNVLCNIAEPKGGEHPPVDDVGENGGGILADPVELALLLELLETAGLAHIVHQNHDRDFVQMHHAAGGDLVSHLYRIVTEGTIIREKPRYMGGIQVGVSRRYCYQGKYYSVFDVGDDGFIVTAHPERK